MTRTARYGAVGGVAALAAFLLLAGPVAVWEALLAVEVRPVLGVVAFGLAGVCAWGTSLWVVLTRLEGRVRYHRGLLLYLASIFCSVVTPFGQAGGDAASAAVIARGADTAYETALAAITSVNTLNRAVSLAVGSVGLVAFASVETGRLAVAAALAVTLLAAVAWCLRARLAAAVTVSLSVLVRYAARVVPGLETPEEGAVDARVRSYVEHLERLAAEPRTLAVVLALGVVGELAVSGALWVTLRSLGTPAPLAVVVAVVPASRFAAVLPTPGGVGGVGPAIAAMLSTAAAVPLSAAAAAALTYRACTYGLPAVVGGAATATVVAGPDGA
jgi:hypothetical protein